MLNFPSSPYKRIVTSSWLYVFYTSLLNFIQLKINHLQNKHKINLFSNY